MTLLKKIVLALTTAIGLAFPVITHAQFTTFQGGTGLTTYSAGDLIYAATLNPIRFTKLTIGANGQCLTSNGTVPLWGTCASGGSGVSPFSTTTSQVSGQLIVYPNNTTDIVVIGSTATTSAEFWFDPNTLLAKFVANLWVTGSTTLSNLTFVNATGTQATTTAFNTTSLKVSTLTGLLQGISGVVSASSTLSVAYGGTSSTTLTGLLKGNGVGVIQTAVQDTDYQVPLTFGDGLTRTANDIDCDTASGSVFGCLASADWTTFNNKVGTSLTLTVAGTANQITSSAGAQDLSANRTWTLSLPSALIFPAGFTATASSTLLNFTALNATTSNATSTGSIAATVLTIPGTSDGCATFAGTILGSTGSACGSGGSGGNSKWGTSTVDTAGIYSIGSGGRSTVSIGTTTANPLAVLTVASNTPALILTDINGATNQKHAGFFWNSGIFTFGTTTDTLTATSSIVSIDPIQQASLSVGTTTATGIVNLGPNPSSTNASSTIRMGKIQFEGTNAAGALTCAYITTANIWLIQAGACNN
jgi:hypothetical protein